MTRKEAANRIYHSYTKRWIDNEYKKFPILGGYVRKLNHGYEIFSYEDESFQDDNQHTKAQGWYPFQSATLAVCLGFNKNSVIFISEVDQWLKTLINIFKKPNIRF
jgi:hypothetical protein